MGKPVIIKTIGLAAKFNVLAIALIIVTAVGICSSTTSPRSSGRRPSILAA